MNTNIALQAQRPRFNALADRNAAMQIQGQQAEQQYNMLRMQAQAQEVQRASQARNALAGLDPTAPDYFNQAAQATQSIDPSMAAGYAQQGQARKLADLSLDEKQLDIVGKRAKAAAQLFNPAVVTDEASWQAAMARGEQLGLNVPRGTPYSAEAVKALQLGALDVKDQLAQQNADRKAANAEIGKTTPYPDAVAEQRARIARAGQSSFIYPPGEKKADELDAQHYHDMYTGLQDASRSSEKLSMDYRLIDSLIGDAYSGGGAAQAQAVKKLVRIVGVDVGNVAGPEAAAMVSNALALKLRNPAGGAGMPGAMSDRDREFLTQMVPGLTTTPEGRKLMIEVQKRIAERDRAVARDARDYRLKNKHLNIDFENMIADKYGGKDIFADLYGSPALQGTSEAATQPAYSSEVVDLVNQYAD